MYRYLLGSGGTLLFDVTIVIQSFLYKNNPPIITHQHHHRPRSHPSRSQTQQSLSPSQSFKRQTHPPFNQTTINTSTSNPLSQSINSLDIETDGRMRIRRSRSRTLSSTLSGVEEPLMTSERPHPNHSDSPTRSRSNWRQGSALPV